MVLPGRPAEAAEVSCGPFSHTQTYRGWGPALSYERDVQVRYVGTRCARTVEDTLHLQITGTAAVTTVGGRPLEIRPFEVSGTWTDPATRAGWPPPWWGCRVKTLDYTWTIPGKYTFAVSAADGRWALDVASTGAQGRSVNWSHAGC